VRLVYGALLAGAAVAPLGRWLGARGNPKAGAWILAILCGVVAVASLWGFLLLGGSLMEDIVGADYAKRLEPVSDAEGLLGGGLLVLAAARLALAYRVRLRLRRALAGVVTDSPETLVLVAAPEAYAFAVPGHVEHILVSEGMLRVLSGRQRRVLFAHERAHLRFAHHRFRLVAQVAEAINPLLLRTESAMVFLCERWADEQAAAEVGDRRLAASSLSAAALAPAGGPSGASAFHEHEVIRRVRALLRPRARLGRAAAVLAALLAVTMLADDFDATLDLLAFLKAFLFA
jgi:Peptidase family M48